MLLVIPVTLMIVTPIPVTQARRQQHQQDQACTTDEQRQADPAYCITNDFGNALKHGIMGFGDALTSRADTPPR